MKDRKSLVSLSKRIDDDQEMKILHPFHFVGGRPRTHTGWIEMDTG